jgi:hypothetical protein
MRTFVIATTSVAGLFSSAAFTQGQSQGTASIRDFSGMWSYPYCCGFAAPLSGGPGPVTNRARPLYQFVGDYTNPILKPQAAEVVKRHGDIEASGVPYPTPRNQCWPEGMPFVLANLGMQMIQQPDRITILYDYDHQVRHVRMNEAHPAQVAPSWYGDSIGRYDGDTLVIDTVGVKIGPFAMVDWYGTPYTQALHVVERYRLIDDDVAKEAQERGGRDNARLESSDSGIAPDPEYKGKGLQLQFTVEDDGVFTMPWSASVTYRRASVASGEWPERVCAENPHGYFPVKKAAIPTADKPDF